MTRDFISFPCVFSEIVPTRSYSFLIFRAWFVPGFKITRCALWRTGYPSDEKPVAFCPMNTNRLRGYDMKWCPYSPDSPLLNSAPKNYVHSVGTEADSFMITSTGRPTNFPWYVEPVIGPVMTKNVAGNFQPFHDGQRAGKLVSGSVVIRNGYCAIFTILPFGNRCTATLRHTKIDAYTQCCILPEA